MSGNQAMSEYVQNIVKSQPVDELKTNVIAFLDYASVNSDRKEMLCKQLLHAVIEFGKPYLKPRQGQDKKVVYIPPEDAPVVMITSCVPVTDDAGMVMAGLARFAERCGEFVDPIEDIISEAEMDAVLNAAQKRFGIMDVICLLRPLKILSFHNSHRVFNCECGIAGKYSSESVVFVYHPRDVAVYDRVYIFAHEIGHALHLALTHDVSRAPEGFDAFNESLGITGMTVQEKQENFADAVAIAVLNSKELRSHLPGQLLKQLPPYFERYIQSVTNDFFEKLHWKR